VHRASAPYKTFRSAVAQESLLEQPSDLRFWRPTGIGFLSNGKEPIICADGSNEEFVVVYETLPKPGQKEEVLQRLRDVANDCGGALSFWVLERGESDGDGVYVFSRWTGKGAWEAFMESGSGRVMRLVEGECEQWLCTKWHGRGLGFLARKGCSGGRG
jgi:quinol monooxygenase YgiN